MIYYEQKGANDMKNEVSKFKAYLSKDLASRYSISAKEASKIVKKSAVNRLLLTNPEFVMHDPIESWSRDLWKEHKRYTDDTTIYIVALRG
jgi:hypothetical protein